MPIHLQQYQIGIIYTHKGAKRPKYDTRRKIDQITFSNIKLSLLLRVILILSITYNLIDHENVLNNTKINGTNQTLNDFFHYLPIFFNIKHKVKIKILSEKYFFMSILYIDNYSIIN